MEEKFLINYEKYKNDVYRLALAYTKDQIISEDIVQNVFIKYYKRLDKIDDKYIKNWLYKVTINECKSFFKSLWRKSVRELQDDDVIHNDKYSNFLDELKKLSKKDSLVVHLYYYDGYKVKEISQILDMSESNVKVRLHRSREILKNLLREE